MKIISWNIGGLGSRKERMVLKGFVYYETPNIVMLQETKKETCDRRFVGSVWKVRNKEQAILPACGALGGVVIIWGSNKFSCSELVLGSFSVTIRSVSNEEGIFWLNLVYGPNNSNLRKDFWMKLQDLFGLMFSK